MKAFWFNIFGTAVSILIYYFLWKHVFQSGEELYGFTAAEITAYVILSRLLSSQFSGGIDREFSDWVRKGDIVVELLRPVSVVFTLFGRRVGEFLFFLVMKGIPVSILATFLLGGVGPRGIENFVLFLASVFISIGLMFWIEVMVGLISFFTLGAYGLRFAKTALMSILSGGIVPLFLFPGGMVKVLEYMPFAGMVSVPVHIYLGKYSVQEAFSFLGLQIVWAVLLGIAAMMFYRFAIKKVVVQGG